MAENTFNMLSDLKKNAGEAVKFHVENPNTLWVLSGREDFYQLFKNSKSHEVFMRSFFDMVDSVVESRLKRLTAFPHNLEFRGRVLVFDPIDTMHDGIAENLSGGFFDGSDVPPPEFWLGEENEKLISFIPSDFFSRANDGVEHCLGGALVWGEDLIVEI